MAVDDGLCIWRLIQDYDLADYSLMIPSVSVGNVGQLACDLLVRSLNCEKIGLVYSKALVPLIGHDAFDLDSKGLTTSCEIFRSIEKKIVLLHIRGPLVYDYAKKFLEEVVTFLREKHIKEIVVLSSSYAQENRHVAASPFRYVANEYCLHKDVIHNLGWMEHEPNDGTWVLPGGGYAKMLFSIAESHEIPCFILFKYCSEGNNTPDAVGMLQHLDGVLSLARNGKGLINELIEPPSWKNLFGRPPPNHIY